MSTRRVFPLLGVVSRPHEISSALELVWFCRVAGLSAMNIASRLCPEVFISANPFSHFEQSTPVPFPQRTGLLEIMTGLV